MKTWKKYIYQQIFYKWFTIYHFWEIDIQFEVIFLCYKCNEVTKQQYTNCKKRKSGKKILLKVPAYFV